MKGKAVFLEADVKIGDANHVENHVENLEDVNHVEKRNVRVKEGVEEGVNKRDVLEYYFFNSLVII